MFIRPRAKSNVAWTLMETMIGVAVFAIVSLALASILIFTVRSFAAVANYSVLDQYNRQAMDKLVSELRQAVQVTGYQSNATSRSLTFVNGQNQTVTYSFDSTRQQVQRSCEGTVQTLLTNCNLLNFSLYMRPPAPPTNSTFDFYPVVIQSTNWQTVVKVVQLSWKTSMSISPTTRINSEDIQTACVVIRKQRSG